jgi:hypothetical protein
MKTIITTILLTVTLGVTGQNFKNLKTLVNIHNSQDTEKLVKMGEGEVVLLEDGKTTLYFENRYIVTNPINGNSRKYSGFHFKHINKDENSFDLNMEIEMDDGSLVQWEGVGFELKGKYLTKFVDPYDIDWRVVTVEDEDDTYEIED